MSGITPLHSPSKFPKWGICRSILQFTHSNPLKSLLLPLKNTQTRFHSTFPIFFPLLILMFTQVNSIIKEYSCRKCVNFFMHQTKYLVNIRLYILSLRSINSMQDPEKTYKWAIMSIDFQVFCLEVDIYLIFFPGKTT